MWSTRRQRTILGHHLFVLVKTKGLNLLTLSFIPSTRLTRNDCSDLQYKPRNQMSTVGWYCTIMIAMRWHCPKLVILVLRGWMGISIATIAIQWFARCAIECILSRHWTHTYHRCITGVSCCLFLLELLCASCLQGSEWYSPARIVRLVHWWWHLLERCICSCVWTGRATSLAERALNQSKCHTFSVAMVTITRSRNSIVCSLICPNRMVVMYWFGKL